MKEFGRLELVELRGIWPREDREFTPWLAENLTLLGDALGLDLELKSTEAPVGDFSLDILARDLNRDRIVVIENQLAPTDHDHLGKLLTYASGYDAGVVVWIGTEIRDEHRQALDWLNQHTDTGTDFFGVIVEALQIDGSRPAIQFRLVAAPNEWRKSRVSEQPSARGEAYRAFFQKLIDDLREHHGFTAARAGQPQNWYTFSSGMRGIGYGASFAQGGRCRAEVYLDPGDESENKKLFDELAAQKGDIEAEYGEALTWERLDDRRASRVAIYRTGRVEDEGALPEIHAWYVDRLLKLKRVFGKRLEELLP